MNWSDHAIWWHVYPLGFTGAPRESPPPGAGPGGAPDAVPGPSRLSRLSGWLDYLLALGCNGLALGPVFASETHGYDTVDHLRIDSRLGEESDLLRLVDEASAKGVRILLDGVFNHVGRSFPAFADVAERGALSPYASWFRAGPDGGHATFEGHEHLVALNHDEPAVADYVTEVMTYWLERGIAGWRLDAAYSVPPSFWRTVTDRVRARFPDAWLTGEVIHGDYAAFVTEGGLDSVTQYELWKATWSSLNDRNFFELAHALGRHNTLLETFAPQTFLGNHDVTRVASRLEDPRHLEHAVVLLFTTGGVPSVYAGDEQAFRGVKEDRAGGDDAVRPAFPESPDQLAPYGAPVYRLHQLLIGLRRRHPWLVRARTTVTELTNTSLVYTVTDGSSRTLAVALNLGEAPVVLPLPPAARSWERLAGNGGEVTGEGAGEGAGRGVTLSAAGWAIAGLDGTP